MIRKEPAMSQPEFTEEQKNYLQGFAAGSGLARMPLNVLPAAPAVAKPAEEIPSGPDGLSRVAQNRFLAAGKKLTNEEQAKRNKSGLDIWDEMIDIPRGRMSFSSNSRAFSTSLRPRIRSCAGCGFPPG
jgi:hypothetical protein